MSIHRSGRITGYRHLSIDSRTINGAEVRFAATWHSIAASVNTDGNELIAQGAFKACGYSMPFWAITTVNARELFKQGRAVLRRGAHQRLRNGHRWDQ